MRISDWSSDVCSSDLPDDRRCRLPHQGGQHPSDLRHGDLTASERGQAFGFHARPRSGHREEVLPDRSEEHTSELQSLMRISYAVFCLKKKKKNNITHKHMTKIILKYIN